jgi:TRAP-type C4-dicarboxylate transport system substrate-binding protein
VSAAPAWRLAASAATLLVLLSACGSGTTGLPDKAGGDPTVTLTVATSDNDALPSSVILRQFAEQVVQASSGHVRIQPTFEASGGAADAEQTTIEQVRKGTFDLGWVGSRAWDTLGVLSFQALQDPFLITDYGLLDAVMTSDIPARMLAGLTPTGLVGLGLFPEQLRHPVGLRGPLATAAAFRGASIRVPGSTVSDALMRALGATPVHAGGAALSDMIANGTLTGAESSAGNVTPFPADSWITANVSFYPKTVTLFMTATRRDTLSQAVRDALALAVQRTLVWALAQDPEGDAIATFCETGGKVAMAAPSDLDALSQAAASVTKTLEADAETATFITQIEALRAGTPEAASRSTMAHCPGASSSP